MFSPGKNVKSVDFRNGFPSITSSGTTIPGSSAETCTVWPPSASCPTSFIATQQPEKRDSAMAWRPSVRNSPVEAGYSTGMPCPTNA